MRVLVRSHVPNDNIIHYTEFYGVTVTSFVVRCFMSPCSISLGRNINNALNFPFDLLPRRPQLTGMRVNLHQWISCIEKLFLTLFFFQALHFVQIDLLTLNRTNFKRFLDHAIRFEVFCGPSKRLRLKKNGN